MVFWALAAILTAVVTIALLAPMARSTRGAAGSDAAAHDLEVYRDQLAEIERDEAAGLIDTAEAESARTEVSRRMLRAAKADRSDPAASKFRSRAALRYAVLIFVPGLALATYLVSGAPNLPHQPLASRLSTPATTTAQAGNAPPQVLELIARAEQHLADNPEDGRGWDVLAPIYARVGRLEDSRTAYANAIRLLGASPERQSGFGETLVALAGGVVTEEARLAFESARELEPEDPKSAFFLALALAQEGRTERARAAFQTIAERSEPDAPWMRAVNAQLAALETGTDAAAGSPAPAARGPSQQDMAAASQMAPDAQQAMIADMVRSLDERLQQNPDDLEGWVRLVRSYGVLGDANRATAALERGLTHFAPETEGGEALLQVARETGVALPEGTSGTSPAGQEPREIN